MGPAFKPDRRTEIGRLAKRGLKDSEISEKVGVRRSWVSRIRKELGIPRQDLSRRGPRAWEPKQALPLYRRGLNDREIAVKLEVSRETVQKWRKSKGLAPNGWGRKA